jgi:hypothetical protein
MSYFISIELSENVNQVTIHNSIIYEMPELRSIAFPEGCSVNLADALNR